MKKPYQKKWLPISAQLERLKSYGLVVPSGENAKRFLRHLNYYRFSGYGLAFEKTRHRFEPGTHFDQIRKAYEFDRALRDLLFEALEVIELDVRTSVTYTFGQRYRAFGHGISFNFYKGFKHQGWIEDIQRETKRSREKFVEHFKKTYEEYPNLPIWVVTEIISFGALSRMVAGMHKADQKSISGRYGLQPSHFSSCLHHLVYVRNLCAHHARLWDREWSIKPTLPPGKLWQAPLLPGNDRLFASLLLQKKLLNSIKAEETFTHEWKQRMQNIVDTLVPNCHNPLKMMGFTKDWKRHPIWSAQNIGPRG